MSLQCLRIMWPTLLSTADRCASYKANYAVVLVVVVVEGIGGSGLMTISIYRQ